jgi:hypothetical protein
LSPAVTPASVGTTPMSPSASGDARLDMMSKSLTDLQLEMVGACNHDAWQTTYNVAFAV